MKNHEKAIAKKYKICFFTLMYVAILFFSFPILRLFKSSSLSIHVNKCKYKFTLPYDLIYFKKEEKDSYKSYNFYNIWSKKNIYSVDFFKNKEGISYKIFSDALENRNCIIFRKIEGFNITEIKFNPNFTNDFCDLLYVEELDCLIFYYGSYFDKEKRIKQFLHHWEKIE